MKLYCSSRYTHLMAARMRHWQPLSLACTLALMDGICHHSVICELFYSIYSSLKTENNLEVVKAIPVDKILLETGIKKMYSNRMFSCTVR